MKFPFKRRGGSRYEIDMTRGPLLPKILQFSLPLVLTGILQLLYNAADVIVVGNFAGHTALAAVSSTGSLINLLVNVFMGLSVGASVVIAQAYGAGDMPRMRKAEHTAMTLALGMGIGVGVMGIVLARPLLEWMDSPPDVIDGATLYVRIYFMGMPANMLYNFGAAVLRAVGDTKRPLYYLTISGLVNVALNLLLVIVFRMDVAGVAIATVVSQAVSMVLVLLCLLRSPGAIRLELRECRVDRKSALAMVRIGLPAGLQGCVFSISNVLIQSSVNSFGSIAMAGNTSAANIEGFIYVSMNAMYQTALSFAGQNMGAKEYGRLKKITFLSMATVAVIGFTVGMAAYFFGKELLGIYSSDPEVIRYGLIRVGIIFPTYFLCGMMDVMVGNLRGLGYSFLPMCISLTGACGLRVLWILTIFAASPPTHPDHASTCPTPSPGGSFPFGPSRYRRSSSCWTPATRFPSSPGIGRK